MPTETKMPTHSVDPSKTRLQMMGDVLIVDRVEKPSATRIGSLILPQTTTLLAYSVGTVVSAGPGSFTLAGVRAGMPYKKGDVILFLQQAGRELIWGGRQYVFLGEGDVIAKEVPIDEPEPARGV